MLHRIQPAHGVTALSTVLLREELARVAPGRGSAVTIGVFDGVHRGHRHLIDRVRARAAADGLAAGVITFHPHPRIVLGKHDGPIYLLGLEERLELLRETGIDFVATVTFTSSLAQLSAREFLETMEEALQVRRILVGPGFALGRGREAGEAELAELGLELGFSFETVDPLVEDGQVISSSAVRGALAVGDVRRAAELLGRPFALAGPVVHGDHRGRSIGFPTANLAIGTDRWLPADGVYATRAFIGEAVLASATNIGLRPTFAPGARTVETHLIDFEGDIYGHELRIEFVERLRGEQRFPGIDALKAQIEFDIRRAREILR